MTAKKTSKAATGGNTPAHKVVTPESVRAAQPRVETAGETKGSDTNVAGCTVEPGAIPATPGTNQFQYSDLFAGPWDLMHIDHLVGRGETLYADAGEMYTNAIEICRSPEDVIRSVLNLIAERPLVEELHVTDTIKLKNVLVVIGYEVQDLTRCPTDPSGELSSVGMGTYINRHVAEAQLHVRLTAIVKRT